MNDDLQLNTIVGDSSNNNNNDFSNQTINVDDVQLESNEDTILPNISTRFVFVDDFEMN
jgi:hypothetical protein